jgi:hypothetical protein
VKKHQGILIVSLISRQKEPKDINSSSWFHHLIIRNLGELSGRASPTETFRMQDYASVLSEGVTSLRTWSTSISFVLILHFTEG